MLTSIIKYSWPQHQPYPTVTDEQVAALDELEFAIEADLAPTEFLDPHQFIPTVPLVDSTILQDLVDVEFVPAILVLRKKEQLYIYDGHHRATRALLDGQLVRSVIFDLEGNNDA